MKLIVNKTPDNIPHEMIDPTTHVAHDSSLVPLDLVEKFTEVVVYSQTSSRSIKFLFENFFHLIYDQPSTFKTAMKELITNKEAYLHLHINTLTCNNASQLPTTSNKTVPKGNEDMMHMLIGMLGNNSGLFGSNGKRNIED